MDLIEASLSDVFDVVSVFIDIVASQLTLYARLLCKTA